MFYAYLLEWRQLNCTSKFATIYMSLEPLSRSLELLIFNAQTIVGKLMDSLNDSDISADEPVFSYILLFTNNSSTFITNC